VNFGLLSDNPSASQQCGHSNRGNHSFHGETTFRAIAFNW
jgi:hypothetical protein